MIPNADIFVSCHFLPKFLYFSYKMPYFLRLKSRRSVCFTCPDAIRGSFDSPAEHLQNEMTDRESMIWKGCIQPIGFRMNRPVVHVISDNAPLNRCIALTHISCALKLHFINILWTKYCGLLDKTSQLFHLNNSDILHVPGFIISFISIVEFLFILPDLQHLLSCSTFVAMHKNSEAKYLKTYLALDFILLTGEPNSWVQILTSSHSTCTKIFISTGLNTTLTLNTYKAQKYTKLYTNYAKSFNNKPSEPNRQTAINHVSVGRRKTQKPTSTFLHHLSIISTVCGGDALSQVMLGNEY